MTDADQNAELAVRFAHSLARNEVQRGCYAIRDADGVVIASVVFVNGDEDAKSLIQIMEELFKVFDNRDYMEKHRGIA